jgi:hypothetical protein
MLPTTSYPPVFTDPKLESDFARDGYVVLPLLNQREVEELKAAYAENVTELPDPITMTGMGSDVARRRRLGERLYEVMGPPMARLMPDFTVVTGRNFIVKRGGDKAGRMLMHQDFSFVDQTVERGVHVWIPLVDVNHENGCLKVSPGSHRLINHIAGPGGLPNPYDAVLDELDENCTVSLPMRAGEALFFDERLMHGSEPNQIPADRPAANIAFVRTGLKQRMHIVSKETPDVLDIFELDHEFAIQYTVAHDYTWIDPGAVRKIGTMQYRPAPLTVERIEPLRIRGKKVETPVTAPVAAGPGPITSSMPKMPAPQPGGFFSRFFGGHA